MTRIFRDFWDSSLTARLTRRVLVIVAATFLLLLAILKIQYLMERDSLRDATLQMQAYDISCI
mgnify:FL=1